VLTLAFLATTRTGHSYVVTVLAEDPSAPINQATAIPVILSAVKAAFTLAARAGQAIHTAARGTRSSRQPPELNPASALTRRPATITRQKPTSRRARHAAGKQMPTKPDASACSQRHQAGRGHREHHDHRIRAASRNSSATAAPKRLICTRQCAPASVPIHAPNRRSEIRRPDSLTHAV
jgi:hypothetical protein